MNNRNPKVRRLEYTTDVYSNFEYNADQNTNNFNEVNRVKFQNNEADIILDRKINYTYTPGRCGGDAFSVSLLISSDYWHSVTVSKFVLTILNSFAQIVNVFLGYS